MYTLCVLLSSPVLHLQQAMACVDAFPQVASWRALVSTEFLRVRACIDLVWVTEALVQALEKKNLIHQVQPIVKSILIQ